MSNKNRMRFTNGMVLTRGKQTTILNLIKDKDKSLDNKCKIH